MKKVKGRIIDGVCGDSLCKGKGTYLLPVRCELCPFMGWLRRTNGHHSYSIFEKCPYCENKLEQDHNREVVTRA